MNLATIAYACALMFAILMVASSALIAARSSSQEKPAILKWLNLASSAGVVVCCVIGVVASLLT